MDPIKHLAVFNPSKVDRPISIIGVGALGSAVSLLLAKLSLNLVLFDFDTVEPHNISNQILYGPDDIAKFKVQAAGDRLFHLTGSRPSTINRKVTGKSNIRGSQSVFVCVDNMEQREAILNYTFCAGIDYLVEGRMGARNGAAYLINPDDPVQVDQYKMELYPDNDVVHDRAACGTIQSIAATASITASYMVWMFMNAVQTGDVVNEIIFDTSPMSITSRRFKTSSDI